LCDEHAKRTGERFPVDRLIVANLGGQFEYLQV
jgi:hypothetical protein